MNKRMLEVSCRSLKGTARKANWVMVGFRIRTWRKGLRS